MVIPCRGVEWIIGFTKIQIVFKEKQIIEVRLQKGRQLRKKKSDLDIEK